MTEEKIAIYQSMVNRGEMSEKKFMQILRRNDAARKPWRAPEPLLLCSRDWWCSDTLIYESLWLHETYDGFEIRDGYGAFFANFHTKQDAMDWYSENYADGKYINSERH